MTEGDTPKPDGLTAAMTGSRTLEIKKAVLLQLLRRHLDKRVPLNAYVEFTKETESGSGGNLLVSWPENETLSVKV